MAIIIYLLKVNLALVAFYTFYWVFLRKNTFFQTNRFYLVSSVIVSFLLPLIKIKHNYIVAQPLPLTLNEISFQNAQPVLYQPVINSVESLPLNWFDFISMIYLAGACFLALRFIYSIIRVFVLLNRSEPLDFVETYTGTHYWLLQNELNDSSFSFFNFLVLNQDDLRQNHAIIREHEEVHINQKHSWDIVLLEIVHIFCWFNPVVFFYKKSLKLLHEFIADQFVNDLQPADYAQFLFAYNFRTNTSHLSNDFYRSSLLKERIKMLVRNRSSKWVLAKYVFIIPLVVLVGYFVMAQNVAKAQNKIEFLNSNDLANLKDKELDFDNFLSKITPFSSKKDTLDDDIFTMAEQSPTYEGGLEGLFRLIGTEIKYPKIARNSNTEGKVFVQFVVEKDGSVRHTKIMKGIGNGCDEEAQRVILASSGKWKAGIQNGKPVRVYFTIPISFVIEREKSVNEGQSLSEIVVASYPKSEIPLGVNPKKVDYILDTKNGVMVTEKIMITGNFNDLEIPVNGNSIDRIGSIETRGHLLVVDGIVRQDIKNAIPDPNNIESISVLKNQSAIQVYGEKGKNGVVLIKTKQKNFDIITNFTNSDPLYLLEGKEITKAEADKINPDTIESIMVQKQNLSATYGEKAKNGVVIIKLKK